MSQQPNINLTELGLSISDTPLLMSAEELAGFLNISANQLAHFRSEYGIRRIKGTNKYSTIEAIRAIAQNKPVETRGNLSVAVAALNKHAIVGA